MKLHQYPGLAKHKAEHDALLKTVLNFQTEVNAETGTVNAAQVLQFLKEWLQHHIKRVRHRVCPVVKGKEREIAAQPRVVYLQHPWIFSRSSSRE